MASLQVWPPVPTRTLDLGHFLSPARSPWAAEGSEVLVGLWSRPVARLLQILVFWTSHGGG